MMTEKNNQRLSGVTKRSYSYQPECEYCPITTHLDVLYYSYMVSYGLLYMTNSKAET